MSTSPGQKQKREVINEHGPFDLSEAVPLLSESNEAQTTIENLCHNGCLLSKPPTTKQNAHANDKQNGVKR